MTVDACSRRALLAGLAAVLLPVPAAARPLDTLAAAGTLSIAVYRDFAPWSWRDAGGTLKGIDVDLGTALAAALRLKAQFTDFLADESVDDDLRNMVWRGPLIGGSACDLMMHVPTDRRFALTVDRCVIGAAYAREGFAIACGPGADCEVPPPQWAGKRLAAELDSIPDIWLSGSFAGVLRGQVSHHLSGAAALAALIAGKADVAMASKAQIDHALANNAAPHIKRRTGPIPALPSPGWDVGLAVKDDSRDLADALEAVMERFAGDGTLDRIFAPYGVTRTAPLGNG
ncbi:MAG: transporter substrate-binding domain-containing protein [Alphaproteobacteria bacterium]|nr:transporter substrate-binding domain-containing protein [Alphaproteobacteria bacterium]